MIFPSLTTSLALLAVGFVIGLVLYEAFPSIFAPKK